VPAADATPAGAARPVSVHRADRVRDWIALGLVIVGALLYGAAHRGMTTLARDRSVTTSEAAARGEWKIVRWTRLERISRVGILFVTAGAGVAVWSFARHAARRRGAQNATQENRT
jgi:hypothetical protein